MSLCNMNRHWIVCAVLVVLSTLSWVSQSQNLENHAIFHFRPIFYLNPTGKLADGGRCETFLGQCDPQFKVCISSLNNPNLCNIMRYKSKRFEDINHISVHNCGYFCNDRIASFRSEDGIHIRITVYEHDSVGIGDDEIIADFTYSSSEVPIEKQERSLSSFGRNRASMKIEMYQECASFYYGLNCEIFCQPKDQAYNCSPNGDKQCLPGITGENCDMIDHCHAKPCIPKAVCENSNSSAICHCQESNNARCYVNYNPCADQPCLHGGTCQYHSHDAYMCLCLEGFQGAQCQIAPPEPEVTKSEARNDTPLNLDRDILQQSSQLREKAPSSKHSLSTYFPWLAFTLTMLLLMAVLAAFLKLKSKFRQQSRTETESVHYIPPDENYTVTENIYSGIYPEESSEDIYEDPQEVLKPFSGLGK